MALTDEEWIGADHQRPDLLFDHLCKCSVNLIFACSMQDENFNAQTERGLLHVLRLVLAVGIFRVEQDSDRSSSRYELMQQSKPLCSKASGAHANAGKIPAWPTEVCN